MGKSTLHPCTIELVLWSARQLRVSATLTTQHNTSDKTRATLGAEMAWMEKKSYVAVKLDAELSAVLFQSLSVGGNVY